MGVGSNYYLGAGVKDQRLDTNVCAYLGRRRVGTTT